MSQSKVLIMSTTVFISCSFLDLLVGDIYYIKLGAVSWVQNCLLLAVLRIRSILFSRIRNRIHFMKLIRKRNWVVKNQPKSWKISTKINRNHKNIWHKYLPKNLQNRTFLEKYIFNRNIFFLSWYFLWLPIRRYVIPICNLKYLILICYLIDFFHNYLRKRQNPTISLQETT